MAGLICCNFDTGGWTERWVAGRPGFDGNFVGWLDVSTILPVTIGNGWLDDQDDFKMGINATILTGETTRTAGASRTIIPALVGTYNISPLLSDEGHFSGRGIQLVLLH